MKTHTAQPNPPMDLHTPAYRHLIHTLIALLPSPTDGTPEATPARNHAANTMLESLPDEPKTAPESHVLENETPTGRSANQVAGLRPTRNPDADPADGNEDIDIAGGWPIDAVISSPARSASPRAS